MKYKGTIGHFSILLTTVCIWGKENSYLMPLSEYLPTHYSDSQTNNSNVQHSNKIQYISILLFHYWKGETVRKYSCFYNICKYLRIVWTEVKRLWQFLKMVGLLRYWNKNINSALPDKQLGPSWSWSYGSLIYNYLCSQCLSPLMLWVRTLFMARCIR